MSLPLAVEDFTFLDELFRSQTGTVWKARYQSRRHKIRSKIGLKEGNVCVLKERRAPELGKRKTIMREIDLLEKLDHPNIISCFGHFRDRARGGAPPRGSGVNSNEVLYMVLEYANGGDLYKEICRRKNEGNQGRKKLHFTEREVLGIFYQLCLGVQHLHERGIVHRDIKALNVLRSGKEDRWTYKLGDLGVGRELGADTVMMQTFYGTPLYASPELCANQPYNELTDIWSLGVLLYEICALDHPFSARNLMGLAKAISEAEYPPLSPELYSPFLRDMVAAMLQKNWKERPRINEIIGWLEAPGKGQTLAEDNERQSFSKSVAKRPVSRTSRAGSRRSSRPPSAVSSFQRADSYIEALERDAISNPKSRNDDRGHYISMPSRHKNESGIRRSYREHGKVRDYSSSDVGSQNGEAFADVESSSRRNGGKKAHIGKSQGGGGVPTKERTSNRAQNKHRPLSVGRSTTEEGKYSQEHFVDEQYQSEKQRRRALRRDKVVQARRQQSHQRNADRPKDAWDASHLAHNKPKRIRVVSKSQRNSVSSRMEFHSSDDGVLSEDSLDDNEGRDSMAAGKRPTHSRARNPRNGDPIHSTQTNSDYTDKYSFDGSENRELSVSNSGDSLDSVVRVDFAQKGIRRSGAYQKLHGRHENTSDNHHGSKPVLEPKDDGKNYDKNERKKTGTSYIDVTRRPLDKTSRREQRAENELRRKCLHLERLVKAKRLQKEQHQKKYHSAEIDKVRRQIESLQVKLSARQQKSHEQDSREIKTEGYGETHDSQQKPLSGRYDDSSYGNASNRVNLSREHRRGFGRGEAIRHRRQKMRQSIFDKDLDNNDAEEDDEYSRPSTRSSASTIRDERLEQRWLERSRRIQRNQRRGGPGPPLVVGGFPMPSSSRASSAGSSASRVAARRFDTGNRSKQKSSHNRTKGIASSMLDDVGLSHTRAGLKMRRHQYDEDDFAIHKEDYRNEVDHQRSSNLHSRDSYSEKTDSGLPVRIANDRNRSYSEEGDDGAHSGESSSDESDLWMTDEIGDLKLQRKAYEQRLALHKLEMLKKRPGMSRFTGGGGINEDDGPGSARSWNPITSSWSAISSER